MITYIHIINEINSVANENKYLPDVIVAQDYDPFGIIIPPTFKPYFP